MPRVEGRPWLSKPLPPSAGEATSPPLLCVGVQAQGFGGAPWALPSPSPSCGGSVTTLALRATTTVMRHLRGSSRSAVCHDGFQLFSGRARPRRPALLVGAVAGAFIVEAARCRGDGCAGAGAPSTESERIAGTAERAPITLDAADVDVADGDGRRDRRRDPALRGRRAATSGGGARVTRSRTNGLALGRPSLRHPARPRRRCGGRRGVVMMANVAAGRGRATTRSGDEDPVSSWARARPPRRTTTPPARPGG